MPTLVALDLMDGSPLPGDLRERVSDQIFDTLALIGAGRAAGIAPFGNPDVRHEAPYLAMLNNEAVARAFTDGSPLPGRDPVQDAAAAIARHLQRDGAAAAPAACSTLSQAITKYLAVRRDAHGEDADLATLESRMQIALELIGDKRVDEITGDDLQSCVNDLAWLPPHIAQQPNYDIGKIRCYIAENRQAHGAGLSVSTIAHGYLGRIKAIVRDGCRRARQDEPGQRRDRHGD